MFHESFMEEEISRMFQGCFMISFQSVSRKFQENFQGFLRKFHVHGTHRKSRAEGGLVRGGEQTIFKKFRGGRGHFQKF